MDQILATMKPISQEEWENRSINEHHNMESAVFDYEAVKKSDKFNIKSYKDSIYKGELQDNKRHGAGVMLYRKCRFYEGFW